MSTTLAVEASNADDDNGDIADCNDDCSSTCVVVISTVTGPIDENINDGKKGESVTGADVISTEDMLICDDTKSLLRITPRTQSGGKKESSL